MKKFTTYLFSYISIFSLLYFTIKYYANGFLNFNQRYLFFWTFLVMIILVTLIIGLVNNHELRILKKQNKKLLDNNDELLSKNEELIGLVTKILNKSDEYSNEILVTLLNSREVSLDIYNKMEKGDNNRVV